MNDGQKPSDAGVTLLDGIAPLISEFDTFLLDQWGVIHDGINVHPGALDAMERLAAANKTVIVLSNSGKRAQESHSRMEKLGISRHLYTKIVTSGELVHRNLADPSDEFYRTLGKRFLMFAWDPDRGVIEGTDFEEVTDVTDADFVLCAGTDKQDLAEYQDDLDAALARNLPMICANPDRVSIQPDGSLRMCPGAVAEVYENMGGTVRWHGKPTAEVYRICGEIAGSLDRAIGVGDSLIHDIKGANDAGIASLLICGGIHSEEIRSPVSVSSVLDVTRKYGAVPTHVSALFKW